jgi:hypothetical protein
MEAQVLGERTPVGRKEPDYQADTDSLVTYLERAGVPEAAVNELRAAITDDTQESEGVNESGSWPRVRRWFLTASTDLGTNALGSALATASASFLT